MKSPHQSRGRKLIRNNSFHVIIYSKMYGTSLQHKALTNEDRVFSVSILHHSLSKCLIGKRGIYDQVCMQIVMQLVIGIYQTRTFAHHSPTLNIHYSMHNLPLTYQQWYDGMQSNICRIHDVKWPKNVLCSFSAWRYHWLSFCYVFIYRLYFAIHQVQSTFSYIVFQSAPSLS